MEKKKIMENITDIKYGELPADSPYVKPFRFHYKQNGKSKNWDLLKVHDSVAIIIFNKTRQKLVFVRQFRPAVYYGIISGDGNNASQIDLEKYPISLAITTELCAGIIDKEKLSVKQIAQEEILEECGYDIPLDEIEEVISYRSGVGTSGSEQTLFYAEVTDSQKANNGGGVDDEIIEVVEYTIQEAQNIFKAKNTLSSPPGFLFGVLWFLTNKAPGFTVTQ